MWQNWQIWRWGKLTRGMTRDHVTLTQLMTSRSRVLFRGHSRPVPGTCWKLERLPVLMRSCPHCHLVFRDNCQSDGAPMYFVFYHEMRQNVWSSDLLIAINISASAAIAETDDLAAILCAASCTQGRWSLHGLKRFLQLIWVPFLNSLV